ncbi:PA2779 family protein [Catenovulum sediminis]|uniref:PA2779 family protein n=1 Tax=Catenovulum sediminis TaxID=1740262 RepID=A0ABV1RJX2_9ALTE|nr:PA2779 family protein [Catenovulum sediminis]
MKKLLTSITIIASLLFNTAIAGMVDSSSVLATHQNQVKQAEILQMLADKEVQNKLIALGVSQQVAEKRIANLTPSELKALNQQINDAPAGGVIDLIFSVLIVVAVLDLLGVTDAYSFIEPI